VKAHKFLGLFACTSVDFPNPATHVRRGDTVTFKMTKDCDDDYEMGVLDNDKLFDSPSAHSVSVPKRTTASLPLTVSKNAEYGRHKSDIVFRNKNHDPKFEVDP
jgi:hypothetical protein